ncbi:MAG: hypothetical protein K2N94_11715, partial [Lachnospiraceae bacterium]|nr:hypothetical protein [Lachnospiraceae bacterium]
MKKEELFRAIGNADDSLLARCPLPEEPDEALPSDKAVPQKHILFFAGRSRKRALVLCASVCLVLAAAAFLIPKLFGGNSENFPEFQLSEASRGVKVSCIDSLPDFMPAASSDLRWLDEESLFTYFDTDIFEGTVTGIQNIVVDYSGEKDYRAIASIQVGKVFRGSCMAGDTVQILLPCPIGTEGFWMEDTGVISRLRVGMHGIFMPNVYGKDSISERNGARLLLTDLAPYGFPDGERYAFLETDDGLVFARWAYESIRDASTLA